MKYAHNFVMNFTFKQHKFTTEVIFPINMNSIIRNTKCCSRCSLLQYINQDTQIPNLTYQDTESESNLLVLIRTLLVLLNFYEHTATELTNIVSNHLVYTKGSKD